MTHYLLILLYAKLQKNQHLFEFFSQLNVDLCTSVLDLVLLIPDFFQNVGFFLLHAFCSKNIQNMGKRQIPASFMSSTTTSFSSMISLPRKIMTPSPFLRFAGYIIIFPYP